MRFSRNFPSLIVGRGPQTWSGVGPPLWADPTPPLPWPRTGYPDFVRHPALHGEGLRWDTGPVQASRQVPRNGCQGKNIQLADSLSENGRALSLLTPWSPIRQPYPYPFLATKGYVDDHFNLLSILSSVTISYQLVIDINNLKVLSITISILPNCYCYNIFIPMHCAAL